MRRFLAILCLAIISFNAFSHPWKPRHYVIVDTDGGIDDIRALSLLLASPDVRVLAITVSPGALPAETAWIKVRSLLNSYSHEGLAVGINRGCRFESPSYGTALEGIWGNEKGLSPQTAPGHLELISRIFESEKTKVSFVCLAGLTTVADAAASLPAFASQVKEIIWSAGGDDFRKSFNYAIDPKSAEKILEGKIQARISASPGEKLFYNSATIEALKLIGNPYAKLIIRSVGDPGPGNHEFRMTAYDELTVLLLHYPSMFRSGTDNRLFPPAEKAPLRDSLLRIAAGETVPRNQVIKNLPSDPGFYFPDIAPNVSSIIEKYGPDEWVSGVIANELHRHLGVFAIVGVKMGIRAREYFATGVDEFNVFSHAGSTPPLSCMNDGIQVSTGATPGHGLLNVKADEPFSPAAEFSYLDRKIKITLKPEYATKISSELKEIAFVNSLDSDIYWELVRKNSIRYWLSLDRHEIFTIEDLTPRPPLPE